MVSVIRAASGVPNVPAGFPILFDADMAIIEPAFVWLMEHAELSGRAHASETVRTYGEHLHDWFDSLEQSGIEWREADERVIAAYRNRMLENPSFIIAVKGTVRQAVLLGLAATLSHTLVVWLVALGGMWAFGGLRAEDTEPWFQLASGFIIVGMAVWLLWRARREQLAAARFHDTHSHDDHNHGRHHDHGHHHDDAHSQVPTDEEVHELELATGGYVDAHEAAHAEDIRRRFANSRVTTGQIVVFGLTGGLVPCPGAITVLMLCLQLNRLALGAALVASFSVGLALTMVASGVLAAISVRHVEKRWAGFGEAVRRAPYVSGLVILAVGFYLTFSAWQHLPLH